VNEETRFVVGIGGPMVMIDRYANDIEDQGDFDANDPATWNYQYDKQGNLIEDKAEGIKKITWTVNEKLNT
jgi:YD repeat-containing protein